MILLSLLMFPAMVIRYNMGWYEMMVVDVPLFIGATLSVCSFYLMSQREVFGDDWRSRIKYSAAAASESGSTRLSITRARTSGSAYASRRGRSLIEVKAKTSPQAGSSATPAASGASVVTASSASSRLSERRIRRRGDSRSRRRATACPTRP